MYELILGVCMGESVCERERKCVFMWEREKVFAKSVFVRRVLIRSVCMGKTERASQRVCVYLCVCRKEREYSPRASVCVFC